MNQELKNQLLKICFEYRNILNSVLSQQSGNVSGTCYLTGHVLKSVFEKLEFQSKEISGVLYLRNENGVYMIYGGDELENEGMLIGNYHTWCEITIDGTEYIIDPGIVYLKKFIKDNLKIKLNEKIPPTIVSNIKSERLYKYEKDDSKIEQSKFFLNKLDPSLIQYLVENLLVKSKEILGNDK